MLTRRALRRWPTAEATRAQARQQAGADSPAGAQPPGPEDPPREKRAIYQGARG